MRFRSAVLLVMFTLVCVGLLRAQAALSAEEKALYDYRLTMPRMQQYVQAYRNLAAASADPAVQEWLRKREDDDALSHASLSDLARDIEASPSMARAVRGAGMTPRDFVLFGFAYFQASFVHGMQQQGLVKEIPPQVNKANVDFVAQNQAQLRALQKELEGLERKLSVAAGDDDDDGDDQTADEDDYDDDDPA